MKEGFTTEKDVFQIWINAVLSTSDHTTIVPENQEMEVSKFDCLVRILYNAASAPATVTRNAFNVVRGETKHVVGLRIPIASSKDVYILV
jgi:hypothetical protein